ncbi:sulfite exporter TauE/SafE family protein [Nitrospirillum sp. BR 11164]|uniref:sulfite exporter TauE/SafE family protein n=1 Tax=Nitrospirillum sp. BR 11164 TaxID=3104324 RepID=UPI002AFFD588|nr:sulfite exporter TauE/SafE family protein [Nitrospirillum sp. BR 11164]MEA1649649.1 sulfite exporter TauE/SafE family protein [Nitrospirillum sp. BR 11164]
MQIYLPIAEMSVNVFWVLGLGAMVGFLSGLFGVGGGFLMTPLLIFIGVPPAVAVGTQANQLVGAGVSGVMYHWRKRNVDVKLGLVMQAGGIVGTVLGVLLFGMLQRLGHIDLVISLSYVIFLGGISGLMLMESVRALFRGRRKGVTRGKLHHHTWLHGLPFKMRFPRSRLYISVLLPVGIGFIGGVLVAIMGIGGGFLLVPAMIYILGMPTTLVAGTSLLQIILTTGVAAVLQAATNHTVDILLAMMLLIGGVLGAQLGSRASGYLKGEQARALLALTVLGVAVKLAVDLVLTPDDLYSITTTAGPK